MTRTELELIGSAFKAQWDAITDLRHAGVLNDDAGREQAMAVQSTALRMADTLAKAQPRFNRQHFLKACGFWGGEA